MKTTKQIYDAKQDPTLQDSYIDADETRERVLPDGTALPYRYVHGGFKEKKVKFIFCFPPKEQFKGRFYQYLSPFPGPDEEVASLDKTGEDDKIAFCLQNGAYFVESNMGSEFMFGSKADPTMCFKASAAAAEYSRQVAMEYYGCKRPYGYVYGGSGGGYKTMACIENTNAWDGAVPYVIGSPVSLPNTITMHVQSQRELRRVFGQIIDSMDAGGDGDPCRHMTENEAFMYREMLRMGFPPMAWFIEAAGRIDDGSLPVLYPNVKNKDAGYFEDFWNVPGYLGADPNSSASRDRLQFSGVVKSVHAPVDGVSDNGAGNSVDDAWRKMLANGKDGWIELEEIPQGDDLYLKGVTITITSGEASGKQLLHDQIIPDPKTGGGILTIGMCYGMSDLTAVVDSIKPGDTLTLDNSDYIALQSYYRHQVPDDLSFRAWDQFRDENGRPTLPQRKNVMGYSFSGTGTVQDGQIQGKVIVVQAMMDEGTCPWCADWYRKKVIEATGSEKDFRVYYMEQCLHGDVAMLENNIIVNYLGAHKQALLDLSDWVERGIEPPASSEYRYEDGQIYLEEDATKRRGVQSIVKLTASATGSHAATANGNHAAAATGSHAATANGNHTAAATGSHAATANGSDCVTVKVGEKVTFTAKAVVPHGVGTVTAMDFGFEDIRMIPADDCFPVSGQITHEDYNGQDKATATVTHTFTAPGTYFASVRVKSERSGNEKSMFTQVKNLARARVVVK